MNQISHPRHQILRMRREIRQRTITVTDIEQITPRMRRVHFHSPELHDFESLAPDDHIKLFVPDPTTGVQVRRDYTPRTFSPQAGTLAIDFALHQAGPATAWALSAQPGHSLTIGGPRGSIIVADDFDWYLLIGDETALPAIGRRIETLRADVPVRTIALIANSTERQAFPTRSAWDPLWITRDGTTGTDAQRAIAAIAGATPMPPGDGYVWIAAEADMARSVRDFILNTTTHPRAWMKASGYWMAGQADPSQPGTVKSLPAPIRTVTLNIPLIHDYPCIQKDYSSVPSDFVSITPRHDLRLRSLFSHNRLNPARFQSQHLLTRIVRAMKPSRHLIAIPVLAALLFGATQASAATFDAIAIDDDVGLRGGQAGFGVGEP
jgi:NADPH-dependent ferric siderophore reductase